MDARATMNAALSDLGSKPVAPKPPCPHDRKAFLRAAEIDAGAQLRRLGSVPTTCIEHAYGTTTRLSFQIKVF